MIKNIVKIIVLIAFALQVNILLADNFIVFGDSVSDTAPAQSNGNIGNTGQGNNNWVTFYTG